MTQPGCEKLAGSMGSAITRPSLLTLRSIRENMCCAMAWRSACCSAVWTRALCDAACAADLVRADLMSDPTSVAVIYDSPVNRSVPQQARPRMTNLGFEAELNQGPVLSSLPRGH